jgi:hypothetical protein
MFEKPQYLTPDGYKRSARNPLNKGQLRDSVKSGSDRQPATSAKPQSPLPFLPDPRKALTVGKKKQVISDKAARLIAMAIKDMLRQK